MAPTATGRNNKRLGDSKAATKKGSKKQKVKSSKPLKPSSTSNGPPAPPAQATRSFIKNARTEPAPGTPGQFPPVLYTNVGYQNGVLLDSTGNVPAGYMNACYSNPGHPYGPTLPQKDAALWSHRFSATECSKHGYPNNVLRFVGNITRTVTASTLPKRPAPTKRPMSFPVSKIKRTRISKAQAKKQAQLMLDQRECDEEDISTATTQLMGDWNSVWGPQNIPNTWCPRHGHLLPTMVQDNDYYPLSTLLKWNCVEKSPTAATSNNDAYPGLQSNVPADLRSIFNSLEALQTPQKNLYNTPFVLAYPRVVMCNNDADDDNSFVLQMGVYMHRLLPEILIEKDLQVIFQALDVGSYKVTQGLCLPPTPTNDTFCSSALPKLLYGNEKDEETVDLTREQDQTLQTSTRDADTLSAFSIPGLLKLWENKGNDVSNWPAIQSKLNSTLALDLMLHQQHAVCWMTQMEGLDGFGINSILWEEREFWEGDKYYYAPALGQVRLQAPPKVHGGILSDEMGLGKTIMILGLIAATIDVIKQDVGRSHSTLIIVPPALVGQWEDEIRKATKGRLTVQFYDADEQSYYPEYSEDADVVITTYNALDKQKSAKGLCERSWARVVLDEMQMIRSSTTAIARTCDKLDAPRRWMLSGTPLFEGIEDLRGELNFLSLEPYAAKSEDGFFKFSITNHWDQWSMHGLETLKVLGLLLLRRSKSMTIASSGEPLMGLKPLTVEFIPIPQTPSERAIYCYMEYLVSMELKKDESASRTSCLHLLRKLCITPTLLSGGYGVGSDLKKLNDILVKFNRRNVKRDGTDVGRNDRDKSNLEVLSVRDAIRFLSQSQQAVITDDDFVSGLALGAGGGMAKRSRATTESVVRLISSAKSKLASAKALVKAANKSKYTTLWHWALERITMGLLPCSRVNRSVMTLWRWRAAVYHKTKGVIVDIPPVLLRGWRPSQHFTVNLLKSHPDFAWAHPRALALTNIPKEVTIDEIRDTISHCIGDSAKDMRIAPANGAASWRAILQIQDSDDAKALGIGASSGIPVKTATALPWVTENLIKAQAAFEEVRNEHNVFPTDESKEFLKKKKIELDAAQRGFVIVVDDEESRNIQLSRAKGPSRSQDPALAETLFHASNGAIKDANTTLATQKLVVNEESKKVKNLERSNDIPDEVKQMSAFESLDAMCVKEYEKTFCCICMGVLGSSDPACENENEPGLVTLTACGHLTCKKCLEDYCAHTRPQCPTCRKAVAFTRHVGVVFIDPGLTGEDEKIDIEKRDQAKDVIAKASKMLQDSRGLLDSELWLQLYLSIDMPRQVSRRGHPALSAVPQDLLAHFRAATSMVNVHNAPSVLPSKELGDGLSSKVRALLRDLPGNERSVVFTSLNTTVQHVIAVFKVHGISHRALYTGQSAAVSQRAVEEWKESRVDADGQVSFTARVLIVQAGAAASGLTLTSACKMFFLEPLDHQEEEQQALARCHRFGQVNAVHAKIYYSPVSIESRLLEWRKRATKQGPRGNAVEVYKDIMDTNDDIDDVAVMEETDTEDVNRTLFLLLGLA